MSVSNKGSIADFPARVFAAAGAQKEMHGYIIQYCLPMAQQAVKEFQGIEDMIGPQGLAQSRDDVLWLINLCWQFGAACVKSDMPLATGFFMTANKLWSMLPEDSLSPQEDQHRILTVLSMVATSLEGVDGQLSVDEAKRCLHTLNKAKAQLKRVLSNADTAPLGQNLDKTVVVLEVIVQCSSRQNGSNDTLETFIRDKYATLQELSPRVLHALAKRALSEPYENRQAAAVLFRMCLKKLVQGSSEGNGQSSSSSSMEKALWIYVELLKCATDRKDIQKLANELKGFLSSREGDLDPEEDVGPVDKFIAIAYNHGVSMLEVRNK